MHKSRLLSVDLETKRTMLHLPSTFLATNRAISSFISQVPSTTHGLVKCIGHFRGILAEWDTGFGFGENMKGSLMFIVYTSSDGKSKAVLSCRPVNIVDMVKALHLALESPMVIPSQATAKT